MKNPLDKIILGTAQFGKHYGIANTSGQVAPDEIKKILSIAYQHNIKSLDTASIYGNSEEILGTIGVKQWDVITKESYVPKGELDINYWLERSFRKTLSKLSLDRIYALLIHEAEELFGKNADNIYSSYLKLKSTGLVKKIGVSVYSVEQVEFILANFDIDLIQFPLNVLDRRMIESGVFEQLKHKKIEVHARSIFLQGLLLMKKRPKYFNQWKSLFNRWHIWLKENNYSSYQACLNYALSMPEVNKIIIGIDSYLQLEELINFTFDENFDLPANISSNDVKLLNPSYWEK
ncbi:MAG: aldo/keto reductase [gamma proteobacterium symbiont of Taylorina sp.]|nr:aldo/keto reductase [gamma proteobacterium symbiont of Taylorina sp.]